jgi:hypothetical protein
MTDGVHFIATLASPVNYALTGLCLAFKRIGMNSTGVGVVDVIKWIKRMARSRMFDDEIQFETLSCEISKTPALMHFIFKPSTGHLSERDH